MLVEEYSPSTEEIVWEIYRTTRWLYLRIMYKIGREIIAIRKILHKKGQKIKDSGHAIKFNFSLVRTLWSVALATPSAQPSLILSWRPSLPQAFCLCVLPLGLQSNTHGSNYVSVLGVGQNALWCRPFYKRTLTVPASFKSVSHDHTQPCRQVTKAKVSFSIKLSIPLSLIFLKNKILKQTD